jgi:hypothetical protein
MRRTRASSKQSPPRISGERRRRGPVGRGCRRSARATRPAGRLTRRRTPAHRWRARTVRRHLPSVARKSRASGLLLAATAHSSRALVAERCFQGTLFARLRPRTRRLRGLWIITTPTTSFRVTHSPNTRTPRANTTRSPTKKSRLHDYEWCLRIRDDLRSDPDDAEQPARSTTRTYQQLPKQTETQTKRTRHGPRVESQQHDPSVEEQRRQQRST